MGCGKQEKALALLARIEEREEAGAAGAVRGTVTNTAELQQPIGDENDSADDENHD